MWRMFDSRFVKGLPTLEIEHWKSISLMAHHTASTVTRSYNYGPTAEVMGAACACYGKTVSVHKWYQSKSCSTRVLMIERKKKLSVNEFRCEAFTFTHTHMGQQLRWIFRDANGLMAKMHRTNSFCVLLMTYITWQMACSNDGSSYVKHDDDDVKVNGHISWRYLHENYGDGIPNASCACVILHKIEFNAWTHEV